MAAQPAPPTRPPAPAATPPWAVRLLGAIEAMGPEGYFTRWPSRAVAALLGRLALGPQRAHSREELVELLWPGVALIVGRNRLRQALSTLKSLLEGPGPDAMAVISADRSTVRLAAGAVSCDAIEFERALRSGDAAAARELYQGELMPGHYDDWVLDERRRLATLFERLEALPALPAPAAPAEARQTAANTLPSYWTQLYGVELVAARLRTLVAQQRLVTVYGAGGTGKTRLAVEVAQALRDAPLWPIERIERHGSERSRFGRVAFVGLVDCVDASQAIDAIAAALLITGNDPVARIAETLAGQRTLLVLDNFEQLVAQSRSVIEPLLGKAPGLHLMVTSRRRLGIDGEQLFELGGLTLPEAGAGDAMASPAVALFIDRARAARSDFQGAAPREAAAVRDLVRLLDGMPLAIELAASRVRSHMPAELLRRLRGDGGSPMLDVLTRGAPVVEGRHDSMRRVVAWSWNQLDAAEIGMIEALVTFAAPASAEAVAVVAGIDPGTTQALLERLHDASLVQSREDHQGTLRHVLLQPVREFVAERISADAAREARRRLRRWLLAFGRDAGAAPAAFVRAVAAELPHVYAMITSAPADGAAREALELAVGLSRYWLIDTVEPLPHSVMQLLQAALGELNGDQDAALLCDACVLLSVSRGMSGFPDETCRLADRALAAAPDPRRRSVALTQMAWTRVLCGRHDAAADRALEEALVLARQCGDLTAEALALRMQANSAVNVRQDYTSAEAAAMLAQQLWERLGDRRNAYRRLVDRAICWAWSGRNDEAAIALAACERAAIADGDFAYAATAAWQGGRVAVRLRRWHEAEAALRRCIAGSWQRSNMLALTYGVITLPNALVMTGQVELAAKMQGFAVPHWEGQFGTINAIVKREVRRTRRLLRMKLGAVQAEALRIEGRGMQLAEVVAAALQEPPAAPPG